MLQLQSMGKEPINKRIHSFSKSHDLYERLFLYAILLFNLISDEIPRFVVGSQQEQTLITHCPV